MKVIDSIWFNIPSTTIPPTNNCVGIVLGEFEGENTGGVQKAYIGLSQGVTQKEDEEHVLKYGAPLHFEILIHTFQRWLERETNV